MEGCFMKISLIQLTGRDIRHYKETAAHIIERLEECCSTETDLILLPECAFPGYFIGLSEPSQWRGTLSELKGQIADLAKIHSKYIAIGLADYQGETLVNTLAVFAPSGEVICSAAKSNLWHFDSNWFEYGTNFPVFDTPYGRIGLMVCADGRIPEIARALKLQGAQLILDTVNLVSCAETPSALTNQQYSFMLKERARENNVYIAVCDKCGVEDSSVTMIGRSMVISPDGSVIAECDSVEERILTCDIDLSQAGPVAGREPSEYSILTAQTETLPVYHVRNQPYCLNELEYYTAIIKYPFRSLEDYKEKALHCIDLSTKANCKMAVLPYAKDMELQAIAPELLRATDGQLIVCAGYGQNGQLVITDHEECSHSPISQRVRRLSGGLSVSFLFETEYAVPENVRVQMLNGSDVVIWCDSSTDQKGLAKTRSAENKIFTVRSVPSGEEPAYMINPDGGITATTFRVSEHIVFGMLFTALSRTKTVVPGTDIVMTRHPEAYERLIR